jgi:hypothetical protein
MASYILDAKNNVRAAAHDVDERYKALVNVHNSSNHLLRDRANAIEATEKRRKRTAMATSAALVGDLVATGGACTIGLAFTKLGASIHYSHKLKKHIDKANAVLESEQTATLALLLAFNDLEWACSELREIGRLPSNVHTLGIVHIAFSPGGRMVLTDLALQGIQQAVRSHPEAAMSMGTSSVEAAIHLVEAIAEGAALHTADFVAAALDIVPLFGLVLSIRELSNAVVHARQESEAANMLRRMLETRRENFKPMMEAVNLLYEFGYNSRYGETGEAPRVPRAVVVVSSAYDSILKQVDSGKFKLY